MVVVSLTESVKDVDGIIVVVVVVVAVGTNIFLQQQNAKLSIFPLGQLASVLGRSAHNRVARSAETILQRDMLEISYKGEIGRKHSIQFYFTNKNSIQPNLI